MNIICAGCKQEINVKTERHTHIEDYHGTKKEGESTWHFNCFQKAINRDLTALEKQAASMLKQATSIFNKIPKELKQDEDEEVYLC